MAVVYLVRETQDFVRMRLQERRIPCVTRVKQRIPRTGINGVQHMWRGPVQHRTPRGTIHDPVERIRITRAGNELHIMSFFHKGTPDPFHERTFAAAGPSLQNDRPVPTGMEQPFKIGNEPPLCLAREEKTNTTVVHWMDLLHMFVFHNIVCFIH
ncbi:hypothetical protein SDC9_173442 [bioreactor metagenome]|uniref:Uncharacterized protein n=1 Tax=bioreactor metagenome TaxID=1076179 RepID=A0A645GIQ9_9ZZZZ